MSMYVLDKACAECGLTKPLLWVCAPKLDLHYCADCLEEVVKLIRQNEELLCGE